MKDFDEFIEKQKEAKKKLVSLIEELNRITNEICKLTRENNNILPFVSFDQLGFGCGNTRFEISKDSYDELLEEFGFDKDKDEDEVFDKKLEEQGLEYRIAYYGISGWRSSSSDDC